MATHWLSQTGAIFVLLAISKPCILFRWSLYRFQPKSPHLSSGTLGFPCWGQVQSLLCKSCICIPYRIPHVIPCLHHMLEHCMWLIVFLLLVVLVWVETGDEFVNEEPIEFAYEDQVNSENFAGKMTIPSKSLLSLLARCSLFCYAYATIPKTYLSCLPNCHVKPLTHHVLANCCLAMLPLCSAPLIALLVAGEDWSLFLVGTCLLLRYHYYILSILMHIYTW